MHAAPAAAPAAAASSIRSAGDGRAADCEACSSGAIQQYRLKGPDRPNSSVEIGKAPSVACSPRDHAGYALQADDLLCGCRHLGRLDDQDLLGRCKHATACLI